MVITDQDISTMISKLNAARGEGANVTTFSEAVRAASRDADGRRLELLRSIRAMARRLGVELPENEKIEVARLNKMLIGESTDARIAFKSALHSAGLP